MGATRLLIIAAVLGGLLLARAGYRRWHHRVHNEAVDHPLLPIELVLGAERTWVVFTTPYCATCEPVRLRLAAADPGASVITVDATRRTDLADAFRIRSAPTTLLADARGAIQARLVGADAVVRYLSAPA